MFLKELKILVIACVMMVLIVPAAFAEEGGMGIVDMNGILQRAKAAKNINDQLEKRRKTYQSKITAQEKALRSAEKELLKEKEGLSAAEFSEKRQKFEKDVLSAQKMVQENKRSLEYGLGGSLAILKREAAGVVAEIAKEKGLSMVFLKDSVVLAEKSLDITDEALKRLDKKITKIPVKWDTK